MNKLDKLLEGHVGKLFGKHVALVSIPRLEEWALVVINASHGFLMNLRMVHIGWRVFEQHASSFLTTCWLVVVLVTHPQLL
jgi:hypothetical protein